MKKYLSLFSATLLLLLTTQFMVLGQNIDYTKVDATINNLVAKNKFSGVVLIQKKER